MKIRIRRVTGHIFLLIFETRRDIASTFLRFQEYYESPKFKGKIFTLEEFKKWYINNSPRGKKTGKFTYYSDWDGFNIPSRVLEPFFKGNFDPLSDKETRILHLFKNKRSEFYIIGVPKKIKNMTDIIRHETAHGLFYTNKNYRKEVMKVMRSFDLRDIKKAISAKGNYHKSVLDDECQAYALGCGKDLKTRIPQELQRRLRDIYNKHCR